MNIKHYLSAMAALAMLAACSDYDPGMSENAVDLTDAEIETIQEYTANFVERYGEMDPNHTWGFGELAEMEEMGTRAVQVDRNNWAVAVKENNTVVGVTTAVGTDTQHANGSHYYEYTTKEGYIIPGFPSTVDGLYYIEENNQQVGYTEDQIKSKMQYNQVQPVGDVTDEEIEYVSWWFRTHPNIESETPPFTEYFVQDISQDFDRVTYPDGDWINYDGNGRAVPVKLYNKSDDSFVRNENAESISYGMDYFSVKTKESDGSDFWEHNNNLNKQKANPIARNAPATATDTTALVNSTTTYPNRTLKYWTSEGPSQNTNGQTVYKNGEGFTTSFSFHNSNDNQDYQNYVLVHLKFYGPRTGKFYDGWYLGFDYELHKYTDVGEQYKKTDVERDYVYSNWIVKLAPGNPKFYDEPDERVRTIKRRVMCEDLGSTFDFDFNDLVFDVKYTREEKKVDGNWEPKSDGKWDATITLQAVGGTLPIYITNFDGTEYDAHEKMGGTLSESGTYSPVNVGTGATHDPVTLDMVRVTSTNPDDIVIRVTSPDKEDRGASKVTTMILPSPSGRQSFGENLAPQKICMPVDVRWTKEYQQIEWAYPHFAEWVQNQNGAAGFDNESDWTRTDVDETKLYK